MPNIRPISDLRNYTDVLRDVSEGAPVRCRAFRWLPLMDAPYFAVMPAPLAPKCDSICRSRSVCCD